MRKISFVLAAIMAIALNCNAQSSNGCYRGFIDAGYSIGVGDYEFGRFEVKKWISCLHFKKCKQKKCKQNYLKSYIKTRLYNSKI